MTTEIPGLVQITDEDLPTGGCKITLEIEDGKTDEFYRTFGLKPGDEQGLQLLMIKALEDHLARNGHPINR